MLRMVCPIRNDMDFCFFQSTGQKAALEFVNGQMVLVQRVFGRSVMVLFIQVLFIHNQLFGGGICFNRTPIIIPERNHIGEAINNA